MRPAAMLVAALVVTTGACGSGANESKTVHSAFEDRASASLTQIESGRCSDTAGQFDDLVKARLDAVQLCADFAKYTTLLGTVTAAAKPYSQLKDNLTVVRIPLTLTHGEGEYRVTYRPNGLIAGIYFLRPGVPLGA